MRTIQCATALVAAVGLLAFAGSSLAANPTQADFDLCNKEAQSRASSPAASPSTGGGASGSASGSMSRGTSGSPGGTSVGGGASTATAADPALRGMDPSGKNDTAFQTAYLNCMKRRGF